MFLGNAAVYILPRNKLIQAFPYMNIKSFFRKQMHKKHSGIVNFPLQYQRVKYSFSAAIYIYKLKSHYSQEYWVRATHHMENYINISSISI